MMKNILAILFFVIGLYGQICIGQGSKITSANISFEFVYKGTTGTISGFRSDSTIDWENPENSVFKGSVVSETLDTNNGLRNWSLKSGKYFDVDDYPKISFRSKEVRLDGEKLKVVGDLTIKNTTKPITIVFTKTENQLIGTTSLYSIDYGIKIKKKREDNLVSVKMVFEVK